MSTVIHLSDRVEVMVKVLCNHLEGKSIGFTMEVLGELCRQLTTVVAEDHPEDLEKFRGDLLDLIEDHVYDEESIL